jgi:shikimate kinase
MRKNIVLVGFMGTGKTAVARKLSAELGMKYISVDDIVETRERRTIKDIFDRDGEAYFRKIEKEVVLEISGRPAQVIDPGGGVVLDEENMKNLKKNGVVVCLWAEPETIRQRTGRDARRPLLNVKDPMGKIKELLEYRRPFYVKADIHIETDGVSISRVVEKIKKAIDGEE